MSLFKFKHIRVLQEKKYLLTSVLHEISYYIELFHVSIYNFYLKSLLNHQDYNMGSY